MILRLRGLAEILLVTCYIAVGIWILGPHIAQRGALIPLYWVMVLIGGFYLLWLSPLRLNRDTPAQRGWAFPRERWDGPGQWRQAWPWYAGVTAVVGIGIIAVGWWRDPAVFSRIDPVTFTIRLAGYLFYGTGQVLIFFGFIHTRWRRAIPVPAGRHGAQQHQLMVAIGTTLVFAGIHFPNWPLMGFTAFAGLVWSWLFYWRPNIWLLGMCHALLGTLLHQFIRIIMRIGPFYDDPSGYVMRNVVPGLADLIGQRF